MIDKFTIMIIVFALAIGVVAFYSLNLYEQKPEQGWTFDGLKDNYKVGQKIIFGVKYYDYIEVHLCNFPVVVAKYENQTMWQSDLFALSCPIVTKDNAQYRYAQLEWWIGSDSNHNSVFLGNMNLNKTGTYSIVVTWFKSHDILLQKNITITS